MRTSPSATYRTPSAWPTVRGFSSVALYGATSGNGVTCALRLPRASAEMTLWVSRGPRVASGLSTPLARNGRIGIDIGGAVDVLSFAPRIIHAEPAASTPATHTTT